jgi:hypothetical protein
VPEFEAGRLAPVGLAGVPEIRRRIVALERSQPSTWPPVATLRRLLADVRSFVPGTEALRA